jgi:hypothetical protein
MPHGREIHWQRLKTAGIVGMPPRAVIAALNDHGVEIHDLDEPLVRADLETATPFLPAVYCAILRTAVVNALLCPLDAIFIDTGPGKCDAARYTAQILAQTLPIPVIPTENTDHERLGNPIAESGLPLIEKFQQITAGVRLAAPPAEPPPFSPPTASFWGVPPRDFSILELFPPTTHVHGWTRCMENKTPADHELEMVTDLAVPTVFFAQSFCAKTALARYLAKRHPHGLYLDLDAHTTASAKAKIQAFLELSGAMA